MGKNPNKQTNINIGLPEKSRLAYNLLRTLEMYGLRKQLLRRLRLHFRSSYYELKPNLATLLIIGYVYKNLVSKITLLVIHFYVTSINDLVVVLKERLLFIQT